jgi:hypothetical protein
MRIPYNKSRSFMKTDQSDSQSHMNNNTSRWLRKKTKATWKERSYLESDQRAIETI